MNPLSVIGVAPWLVHVAVFVGLLCWYWLDWCGNVDLGRLDAPQGRVASGSTRHVRCAESILLDCELLSFYFLLLLRLLPEVLVFALVLAPMKPRAQPTSSDPRETASRVPRKGVSGATPSSSLPCPSRCRAPPPLSSLTCLQRRNATSHASVLLLFSASSSLGGMCPRPFSGLRTSAVTCFAAVVRARGDSFAD